MKCKSLFPLLLLVLLFSCSESVPEGIIPPGRMQEMLYDYHLAQAMAARRNSQDLSAEEIMASFYEKHHITSADFDSSLVWYSCHTELLKDIYASVEERYTEEAAKAGTQPVRRTDDLGVTVSGDTTEIWKDVRLFFLTPSRLKTVKTFSVPADTSFYKHDVFRLRFMTRFLKSPSSEQVNGLSVGLVVRYVNDSVSTSFRSVSSNQDVSLVVRADSDYQIRQIAGFFSLNNSQATPLLVDAVRLYKYHTGGKTEEPEESDTTSVPVSDTLRTHPASPVSGPRLSPQELRDAKPAEHRLRIRKR